MIFISSMEYLIDSRNKDVILPNVSKLWFTDLESMGRRGDLLRLFKLIKDFEKVNIMIKIKKNLGRLFQQWEILKIINIYAPVAKEVGKTKGRSYIAYFEATYLY